MIYNDRKDTVRKHDVYDALGHSKAISYQVKVMLSNSPLINSKYGYSDGQKPVYLILYEIRKFFYLLLFRRRNS